MSVYSVSSDIDAAKKINWYTPYDGIATIIHFALVGLYLIGFSFYMWIPLPFCPLGCCCNRLVTKGNGKLVPYKITADTLYAKCCICWLV